MSTCTARPSYGLPELIALVVSLLRPWLDAIRTEFAVAPAKPSAAPQPEALLPGPQPRETVAPQSVAEVPTAPPSVEKVAEVQALQVEPVADERLVGELLAEVPTADVAEVPVVDLTGLFVRRGEGHKVRYFAWDGVEAGHLYRRHVQPNGKATYRQAAPATYQHGIR